MKNCISTLCTGPFTRPLLVETAFWCLWHRHGPALGRARDCKKTSFRILLGVYCHNIPTHTPQSGYHKVAEVAKTANAAKMAEKCINRKSARPTPPHTNPMESEAGNTFSAQNRTKPKDSYFSTQKKGGSFFDPPTTPPPPPPQPPSKPQKSGFQMGGGGSGGVRTKNSLGDVLIGQNNDFQGVKLTIQPLVVGYANRPKKAQNGGYVAFFPIYLALI